VRHASILLEAAGRLNPSHGPGSER